MLCYRLAVPGVTNLVDSETGIENRPGLPKMRLLLWHHLVLQLSLVSLVLQSSVMKIGLMCIHRVLCHHSAVPCPTIVVDGDAGDEDEPDECSLHVVSHLAFPGSAFLVDNDAGD